VNGLRRVSTSLFRRASNLSESPIVLLFVIILRPLTVFVLVDDIDQQHSIPSVLMDLIFRFVLLSTLTSVLFPCISISLPDSSQWSRPNITILHLSSAFPCLMLIFVNPLPQAGNWGNCDITTKMDSRRPPPFIL